MNKFQRWKKRRKERRTQRRLKLILKLTKFVMKFPNFREALVGSLVAVFLGLGEQLGLSSAAQLIIASIGGSYAAANGIAEMNVKKRMEDVKRKLQSKKLMYTLGSIFITALFSKLNFPQLTEIGIGLLATGLNIGQGLKDRSDDSPESSGPEFDVEEVEPVLDEFTELEQLLKE